MHRRALGGVLPEVPVRHWVCTFPWGVRAVLGYDKDLCRAAVSAFAKELQGSLKHRAKREFGLGSVDQALTGLVAVVPRTDGALRLTSTSTFSAWTGCTCKAKTAGLAFHALRAGAFRALGASLPVTFSRSPGPHFAAGELCAVSVTSQRILTELMTKTRGASN